MVLSAAFRFATTVTAATAISATHCLAQTVPASAPAAAFPTRPITVIAPFTAGSSTDIEIRIYQSGLNEFLKQPILVDYKPGASNTIANSYVSKLRPDGHTVVALVATSTILPALKPDLGFDLLKDLAPVSLTTRRTFVLTAWPGLPANNVLELIAYAKANPGKVAWSTAGIGSGLHMAGEWLNSAAGIDMTMVHYKGSAAAEVDMQAGRVHVTPKALSSAQAFIRSKKLKIIGIATAARSPLFSDVKTVAEQGFAGYDYPGWFGMMTTGGTPPAILNRLSAGFRFAVNTPAALKSWEEQGTLPVGSTPEEFRTMLTAEMELWKKLVKVNNIKSED